MAGPHQRQGAQDRKAATEDGSQPDTAPRGRRSRPKGKPKARLRDKKQRPAQSVRLNDREHALIQAAANTVDMSVAGFLAHSALAAARDQSRTAAAIAAEQDVLAELLKMSNRFAWAGSNLNQLTAAFNSGEAIRHISEVLADVQRAANEVSRAATRVANYQIGVAS
ncbi:mobilization protein [Streptomyces atriruber]|uniref:Mobilization protein n=1 Tax=Streptomyces atriruber TaxID=545121 RepID=A0ABV3BX38_9ACTN